MPYHYYNSYDKEINSKSINFYVLVQKNITVQCDMSQGRLGLIASIILYFDDGTYKEIVTDSKWLARVDTSRYGVTKTDFGISKDKRHYAKEIENIWRFKRSPLPNLYEEEIMPVKFEPVEVKPGEVNTVCFELDNPKHQENLGCTGDYFIVSLMNYFNYFTYGDTELTRLDVARTAHCLSGPDGHMFHTTYSMIWILMLYDYYK